MNKTFETYDEKETYKLAFDIASKAKSGASEQDSVSKNR